MPELESPNHLAVFGLALRRQQVGNVDRRNDCSDGRRRTKRSVRHRSETLVGGCVALTRGAAGRADDVGVARIADGEAPDAAAAIVGRAQLVVLAGDLDQQHCRCRALAQILHVNRIC